MKNRLIALLAALLLLSCAVGLAACNNGGGTEKPPVDDDPYLLLVNKQNPAGESFEPEGLCDLDGSYTTGGKEISLEEKVAEAVVSMINAMREDDITNVSVTSGYRTYEYQQKLFNKYIAEEKAAHPDGSDEKVREQVLTYSAAPGTSEHQSGLCVDLFTTEMEGLWNYGSETPKNPYDKGFAETDAFEWLMEHAHEYGFILRFPENKTDITGYSYESWHYRYVGVEHATKIHEQGITLEEYLDSLK